LLACRSLSTLYSAFASTRESLVASEFLYPNGRQVGFSARPHLLGRDFKDE
jgi:hypothetical protein